MPRNVLIVHFRKMPLQRRKHKRIDLTKRGAQLFPRIVQTPMQLGKPPKKMRFGSKLALMRIEIVLGVFVEAVLEQVVWEALDANGANNENTEGKHWIGDQLFGLTSRYQFCSIKAA
jgi:hypothetical protein